jgi:hypothetical protein
MNRKKKVKGIFEKKLKKAKAKLNPKAKPRYISKAERAKMEAEEAVLADKQVGDKQVGEKPSV